MRTIIEQKRKEIEQLVEGLPYKEKKEQTSEAMFEQFEILKWMAFPEDYNWFIQQYGNRELGFDLLGVKSLTPTIQIFRSVKEAKRMSDHTPLVDFLVLEYVDNQDTLNHHFYYIQLKSYRVRQETLPVFYWDGEAGSFKEAYPDFYSYVSARLTEMSKQKKKRML